MTAPTRFPGGIQCNGDIQRGNGRFGPDIPRDNLLREDGAIYPVPLKDCMVWDSGADLPTAGASDDLGFLVGTWGTHAPYLSANDLKAAGATTRRARFVVSLPAEYVAGQSITIRVSAGMLTTVADTTCTVDIEAYLHGRDNTIDGSDLCTTAAQSMNSLTFADKDFTITPTGLVAGDQLDVRLSVACNDAATVTPVTPAIGAIELVTSIRG